MRAVCLLAVGLIYLAPSAARAAPVQLSGRAAYDVVWSQFTPDGGGRIGSTVDGVRRWKLSAEATLATDLSGEVSVVGREGQLEWDDLILAWSPGDWMVSLGNHFQSAPLDVATSDLFVAPPERSAMVDALGLGDRALGVAVQRSWSRAMAVVGFYGDSLNAQANDLKRRDEQSTMQARVVWMSPTESAKLMHLGLNARIRERGGDGFLRYGARPGSAFAPRVLDTGPVGLSDRVVGLEFLAARGAFSGQAELMAGEAQTLFGDLALSGAIAEAMWVATGETRAYNRKSAAFGRTTPARPITAGGPGGLALFARLEHADLSAAPRGGGALTSLTLGMDWRPTAAWLAKLAVSRTHFYDGPLDDGQASTVVFRLQADF